jgi:hypothetical protein
MVELLKAARTESAVIGLGVGMGAPATAEPQALAAIAAAAPHMARILR